MSTKRKQCKKCLRNLSVKEFYRHPTTADGLFPFCKADHARAALCRYRERPDVRRRVKETARRWKKQNPLKAKAQQAAAAANGRASKRGLPGRLTGHDVIRAWEECDYRCAVCGKDLSKKNGDLSLDHRHPLEFGGPNTPNNLRAACRSCNAKEYWKWKREHVEKRVAVNASSEVVNTDSGHLEHPGRWRRARKGPKRRGGLLPGLKFRAF